jgi:hypothetical protein
MPPAKPQQEIPFAMAAIFAVGGGAILVGLLIGYVGPALWVRLAYEPVEATVVDRRLTSSSSGKGGPHYKLEVLLRFSVDGKDCDGWAKLPLITKDAPGPEMDAVLAQAQVGETVNAFHDPFRPIDHVVLDRNRLEGAMIPAVLVPALFLTLGVRGMGASWRKTFPRGVRVDSADLFRRLPRRFYTSIAAALACAGAAAVMLKYLTPFLGCGTVVVVGIAAIGAILFVTRAVRFGSVAVASPERRKASAPVVPPAPNWNAPPPPTVDAGQRLPVRLRANILSDGVLAQGFVLFLGALFVLLIVFCPLSGLRDRVAPPFRQAIPLAAVGIAAAAVVVVTSRVVRDFRALTVEVSAHPLQTGAACTISVAHPNPEVLERLEMELVCEEHSAAGKSSRTHATKTAVLFDKTVSPGVRTGRIEVPAAAPASFRLTHHWVNWHLAAITRRTMRWTARFPVEVRAGVGAAPADVPGGPTRLDEGPAEIWLDADAAEFAPGDTLSGGFTVRPHASGPMRSAELSVLWTTAGPEEMGVAHYEEHAAVEGNDLPLYATRRFSTRLPDGPLSLDGKAVTIRWAVRLRLRYVNGDEVVKDLLFRLAAAAPPPATAALAQTTNENVTEDGVPPPSRIEKIETPQGVCYRFPPTGEHPFGLAVALAVTAAVLLVPGVLASLFIVGNGPALSPAERMLPWLFVAQITYLASLPARLAAESAWRWLVQKFGHFQIELRGDALSWGSQVGPFRRHSRRTIYEIRRLIVYTYRPAPPAYTPAGATPTPRPAESACLAVDGEGAPPVSVATGFHPTWLLPVAEDLRRRACVAGRPLETIATDEQTAVATAETASQTRRRKWRWWVINLAGAVGLAAFSAASGHFGAWRPVSLRTFLTGAWLLEALVFAALVGMEVAGPRAAAKK